MKTYNKYYEEIKAECLNQKETKGSLWEKKDDINDMYIIENNTQVPNSEWVILHRMLVRLLIDYILEHPLKNEVYTYGADIDVLNGNWKIYLNDMVNVNINIPDSDISYNVFESECIPDREILDSYDELTEKIFFFLCKFMSDNRHKIKGLMLCKVFFNVDDIDCSLKLGKWAPETDSTLTIYNNEDELFVCSM